MSDNLETTSATPAVAPASSARLSSDTRLKARRGDAKPSRCSRAACPADARILVAPTSSATAALLAIRAFLESFGEPKRPVTFGADGACTTLTMLPEEDIRHALNSALSALQHLANAERDDGFAPNDHSDLLLRSMLADLKMQGLMPTTAPRAPKGEL